jgi:hypothetical protein
MSIEEENPDVIIDESDIVMTLIAFEDSKISEEENNNTRYLESK